jgi:hypothetical protein
MCKIILCLYLLYELSQCCIHPPPQTKKTPLFTNLMTSILRPIIQYVVNRIEFIDFPDLLFKHFKMLPVFRLTFLHVCNCNVFQLLCTLIVLVECKQRQDLSFVFSLHHQLIANGKKNHT